MLAVGAGWGCFDIFSLGETARYRVKYCLKGLLSTKQPTNCLCNCALGHFSPISTTPKIKTVLDCFER